MFEDDDFFFMLVVGGLMVLTCIGLFIVAVSG
jgi:hypothetical protein